MKKIFLLFILALFCAACSFQTKHRGYIFPDDIETTITKSKTGTALEDKLGSPMAKTVFGDTVWVYYGADENYNGPFKETYDDKTVLLVWLDSSDHITQTKLLHDKDLPEIKIAEGETDIPAAIELNMFQELINNVGRFKPAGMGQ